MGQICRLKSADNVQKGSDFLKRCDKNTRWIKNMELPPSSFQSFVAFVCRIKRLNIPFFVTASLIHAAVTCSSHLEMISLIVIDLLNPRELGGTGVTQAQTL